ncbi:asparaginase [Maritalea mediterranea]|uniref:Asparaginase n=1 Tax=Maritalea mediterranea TaxID=2909667 RepID=A0ABS9E4U9_9HYPH|nr:asparaginase [Maritalea mediterranea]MCF4097895.1 asparaginase [Maritalea mediterranea]
MDQKANPVLVEFTRGNWVENRHRAAFCIADSSGKIVANAGDIEHPIYPRSAIKSLQALALFESGAVEKFGLDDRDLALACASHKGESVHVEGVTRFLDKIGMTVDDLECGAHVPSDKVARNNMRKNGEEPSALHNNCSGKHTGMLAVAKALGEDPKGYIEQGHPVQKLVRTCVEKTVGASMSADRCGRDGCSIPTWASPLRGFATGFAKLSDPHSDLPELYKKAGQQLFDACAQNAMLVAGTDRIDTDAMTAFKGKLMMKVGADGVFCGALRDSHLGFALKVDDGSVPAAEAIVAGLVEKLAEVSEEQKTLLAKWSHKPTKNWRGFEVGTAHLSGEFASFF